MEENKNMEIWNKLKTPPADAMKPILGGRLKGKTDLNPQWRYEAITEVFGVCGVGWKYTINKLWTEAGSQDQVLCFALISFYHRDPMWDGVKDDGWSDPIPGIGGSMLVEKEEKGLHSSDEGYKMAVTDALSVALKMIGVGADVYRGIMESKYAKPPLTEPQAKTQEGLKITDVVIRTTKTGKKVYVISDNNKVKYDTFSETFAKIAKEAKEQNLKVKIESNDTKWGKNLVKIEIVKPEPPDSEELTPEKCHELAEIYKGMISDFNTMTALDTWWTVNDKTIMSIQPIEPKAYLAIMKVYDTKYVELKEKEVEG